MDGRRAPFDAVIAPAPAAFLTFWGLLIYVFGTQPVRPYTDGAWAPGDLLFLGVLGVVIGLVCRPLNAAAGIVLGMAAVVALQLYVLAGQAHYQAVVVAVMVAASLVTRSLIGVAHLANREPGSSAGSTGSPPESPAGPRSGRPDARAVVGLAVAGLAVLVIAGLLAGTSLVTTAQSAYLPAADEPVLTVQRLDDGSLKVEPASVPAGRMTFSAGVTDPLHLYGPLTPQDQAALGGGRLNYHGRDVYWTPRLGRAELPEPGRYAFVVLDPDFVWPQDQAAFEAWDGTVPLLAAHMFDVTAARPRAGLTTTAGGDGGAHLTLPTAAALGIEGWAASGALFLAIRRYRRPTEVHVVVAVMAGIVSAGFVAMLVAFAISQAHSPF